MQRRPADPKPAQTRARHLLVLEPRMMFDAAAAATSAIVGADAVAEAQAQAHVADRHDATAGAADRHPATMAFAGEFAERAVAERHDIGADAAPVADQRDVIFIDTAVSDYQRLADEWADRGRVVLIDSSKDGLDQVRAALAGQHDLGAIHIVSHGAEGVLWLGTTRIDTATIGGSLAASLAAVGRTLAPGGDILIYGCDFAEGDDGAQALDAFARATSADVAASTDLTGNAARGGDWTLEAHRGQIETRALDSHDWQGLLAPIAIAVQPDSLTVRDGTGAIVASGANGFTNTNRSNDVGAGATATWSNAATYNGHSVDLRATIVSVSSGDAVRFDRPTSASDDAGFLLRNIAGTTTGTSTTQIRWELVDSTTGDPIPADVRFTIADIDGVAGNPHTRESLVVSTDHLSYFTRDNPSDIQFAATLASVDASGTQNETASPPVAISAASFDWTNVSAFTITYNLNRAGSTQAAFYHDGDADFVYSNPVYTSIPRLDLDADDSTASGNDAAFTYTENGAPLRVVDADLSVSNPAGSVTHATLVLTDAKPGDILAIGALPTGITGTVDTGTPGRITVSLTGDASAATYEAAIKAVTFANASDTPDTTLRTIDVSFANATLTSAVATSRITVVAVNDAPVANPDQASTAEDHPVTIAVLANDTDAEGDPLTVTAASATHGSVVRNGDGTITYTPDADYNGTDTITYAIEDGHGGTSSSMVTVRVAPQPDAPVNTVPGAQALNEDGVLVFSPATNNALSIADPDGGSQTVTLTVTQGVLTLARTTGLSFSHGDGTADATMTFTGTIAAINAALDGAAYAPDADRNGAAQLTIVTSKVPIEGEDFQNGDLESPAYGLNQFHYVPQGQVPGWSTTASDGLIEVWGAGYEGVPAYQGTQFFEVNATQAASLYQEFRSTAGSPVTLGFAHRGRLGTDVMQLTATDLGADGIFGTADDVVLAQQNYSDGNGAWGTYSRQLTAAATGDLIRVDFKSVSTATGDQSVGNFLDAVTLTQTSVATSDSDTVAITIAPVADIAADSATTAEDTAVTFDPLINDTFANPGRVIAAIDGHAIGAGGAAVAVANGSVALDAASHVVFTPTANYHGTTSFSYTVTSNGTTETATDTITVTPVNDAPAPTGPLPARSTRDAATVSYATAGGFTDVDGDTLSYSATGLPGGLSIDTATGVISGIVDRSASQVDGGAYRVTVTARDPSGATGSQVFSLGVVNPGPAANDDRATTAENTPTTIAVLANDSDPDGDPITVTAATAGHGSVAINADGTLTYTPDTGYVGSDSIAYSITDGQGGTAAARVALTISNTPPSAAGVPPQSARDGQVVALPIGAYFTKPAGATLTFSATALPPGLSIDPATGAITGTIDRSASQANGGRYATMVTADDGRGGRASSDIAWSIANPPPQARNDSATTSEDSAINIAPLANDSDPDGDPLTIVAATAAHGIVTIKPDGTIGYRPDADFNGADTILYTISDGQGGRSTATISVAIAAINDAPTTTGLAEHDNADGATVTVPTAPAFGDVDGDRLSYSAAGLPPGLSIDPATGIIGGTIAPGSANGGTAHDGSFTATVTATDPSGATVDASFVWIVRQAPPIANDDVAVTAEDHAVTVAVIANDTDPDNDPLTIVAASATHGTVTIDGAAITFTPDADFNGTALVTYAVVDGHGGRATATVTITVTPVDDAPDVSPRLVAPAFEIAGVDAQAGILVDAGLFFSDRDGDALTFAVTGLPPGLSLDPATGRITGTIDRAASQVAGGVYTVTLIATDPSGASTGGSFRWFVTNPAPFAANDGVTTAEDTGVVIPVLVNDSDPDGDPLTVIAAQAAHGRVAIAADGTLTYTPDADFNGADTILYTIDDGNGDHASAAVIVTVTPVADVPAIVAPLQHVSADDAGRVAIATAPSFADRDGNALVYTATGLPAGVTIDPATGAITGTLDHRASATVPGGRYPITVTATDPSGLFARSSFDLTARNPAPIATDDLARTAEETAVNVAVLANDRDPDGDTLTITSATAVHGAVTINPDGTVTYLPGADFTGTDTITYAIADGDGGTATATVAVTVDAVNHAPVTPVPGTPIAAVGGRPTLIAPLAGVVDRDGDPVTLTGATASAGVVRILGDGTLAYTPALGFAGTATITYMVADGRGGVATGMLVVRVADGRGADLQALLRFGDATYRAVDQGRVAILRDDGAMRTALSILDTTNAIRDLRGNADVGGATPMTAAIEGIRSLRSIEEGGDGAHPVTDEVARLGRIVDFRDSAGKLFDPRWGDFLVHGLTGFSAAADTGAGVMIESVVRDHATYVEIRDVAATGTAPIRSVDIGMANGGALPDWIRVDRRGLAIIERGADTDELHLIVHVTRTDGHRSSTPIVIQGATGEIEIDRPPARSHAPTLNQSLKTPHAAADARAAHLTRTFQ